MAIGLGVAGRRARAVGGRCPGCLSHLYVILVRAVLRIPLPLQLQHAVGRGDDWDLLSHVMRAHEITVTVAAPGRVHHGFYPESKAASLAAPRSTRTNAFAIGGLTFGWLAPHPGLITHASSL